MTLILNCLTPKHAIQVSDRRLVWPDGTLANDNRNKAILVNGNIVFSYTGLALIDGKTRSDDWFLNALSDIYKEHPNVSLTTTAQHIAKRATDAIRRTNVSSELKRLAFVGVGWGRLTNQDDLRPIYTIISNTHTKNGKWSAETQPHFLVFHFTPPEDKPVMLVADGQPLGDHLRKRLLRQINSCVNKGVSPKSITRLLVGTVRSIAATNEKVGRNLLVNCIPKDSVRIGALRLFGTHPRNSVATFTYIPESTLVPVQYGPYVFAYGVSFKGITVYQTREAS
jgi:hypothetical protein